jgi:uncharacterized protein
VHDAKVGSTARPSHIFQLLFYSDQVARIQGVRPRRIHLMLGSGENPSFLLEDFSAYAASVRRMFEERYDQLAADPPSPAPAYPYPVPACDFCHWWHVCNGRRRHDDHISLVANLQRGQGLKLEGVGVHNVAALAAVSDGVTVPRLSRGTLDVLRDQAALQLASRDLATPMHRVLEPVHERGLARLPEPSEGDVFFDFEGDPFWGEDGLEYLFGTLYREGGEWRYRPIWATSRQEEQAAFEEWIDWLMLRLEAHPDLHVFHFNTYEPVALKRLVARYGVRELELDELLKREVLVDLYGITRQAVRVGTERYGLKALESAYQFERNPELQGAIGSMRHWQAYQADLDAAHLAPIELYNEDDVRSTVALQQWLRDRRPEAEAEWGVSLSSLAPLPREEPSERQKALAERLEALRPRILDGLPDDESLDDAEQRARRIAFDLVGYYSREAKPVWWAMFARREMTIPQLRDEDVEAIADLELVKTEEDGRSWVWTLRFPEQEFKLSPGSVEDPITATGVNLVNVDERERTVVVRRGKQSGGLPPTALAPGGPLSTDAQIDSVFAFADRIADAGLQRAEAGLDLLQRRTPRFATGTPALVEGPVDLDRLKAQVRGLDRSALVIQGPPGTGKTYTGARLALDLMTHGLKVGVTATAHKAINNFLKAVDEAATKTGTSYRGWRRKSGSESVYESANVACGNAPDETDGPVMLHAGTAWHWARPEGAESVDVLFVDEAGQISLADAIAVAQGAKSVVLLGDPQQLAHVSKGTHLHGSGASVLQHMLGDDATIPPDRGVLLTESWRMHPDICDFVSQTMYDGRLTAEPHCARQSIESSGLSGTGLRMIPVEHTHNRHRSVEEAEAISAEIEALLADGWTIDRDGVRRRVTPEDILVVAPYNAQVRCLMAHLPDGTRVGTVDKFQGQEAPMVFFSMAASAGDDIARGMDFLFSSNRLNVALSRAQSLAVVVCSPQLMGCRCSKVDDMRLVNLLCRAAEAAREP